MGLIQSYIDLIPKIASANDLQEQNKKLEIKVRELDSLYSNATNTIYSQGNLLTNKEEQLTKLKEMVTFYQSKNEETQVEDSEFYTHLCRVFAPITVLPRTFLR